MMKKFKKLLLTASALTAVMGLAACGQDKPKINEEKPKTEQTSDAKSEDGKADNKGEETAQKGEVGEISGEDLNKALADKKQKEEYLVLDVRPEEQYDEGHVEWAVNIPVDEIEDNIDRIKQYDGHKKIVTICNTGKKSSEAAEKLAENGLDVLNAVGVKDFDYEPMTKVAFILGDTLQEIADKDSDDYYIIDAREEKDFNEGHLKGAHNIFVDDIDEHMSEIPKDKTIVTYCYSGNKSYTIAQKLMDNGWENVLNGTDGTKEWEFNLVQD